MKSFRRNNFLFTKWKVSRVGDPTRDHKATACLVVIRRIDRSIRLGSDETWKSRQVLSIDFEYAKIDAVLQIPLS